MKIKLEYLDRVYNVGGKNITLRFLDKRLYDNFSKLIPEAFEEEGLHFKENKDKEKFEDTPLFKKTPGYIPPGHIKRKRD